MLRLLPTDPARTWNNTKKKVIAKDMLERYSGCKLRDFQKKIILTNFEYYLKRFSYLCDVPIKSGSALKVAHSKKQKVSLVCFNIGAPMSALVIEMLSILHPKAVLMLGMCGGLHRDLRVGDLFLPMAAIRDEGTSQHFFPPQVPALPTFKIQKLVSETIVNKGLKYHAGVVHTTDYRFWEFDESFKKLLKLEKVGAVEMESASLFITSFACKVPCGALLLVSDLPLRRPKTKSSANRVFRKYTDQTLEIGIESMEELEERGDEVRHFEW